MSEKKESVGAIWIKTAKSGKEYFSISIGEARYVGFLNEYKKAENQPDYKIYESSYEAQPKPVPSDDNIPF